MSTQSTEQIFADAARPGAVLVFEGLKMTGDQIANLKEQFREAYEKNDWPLVVCAPGPVYYAAERDRKSHEFTEFVASLATEEAAEALSAITVGTLIVMAREALQ